MKRYVTTLAFISILGWRLVAGQPAEMVEGTRVKLTIPTVDYPEYLDSKTIVRRGDWEVQIKGYTNFIPGDIVIATGEYTKGKLIAEEAEVISSKEITLIDRGLIVVSRVRNWANGRLQRLLPEPMAALAIGILLGVKREMPFDFYKALVATGTLHVIAASGYNVAVVSSLLVGLFGRVWRRGVAIILAILGIGLYVLLAGGSPSIVRAGIMGCLTLMAFYWGRPTEARRLLMVTIYLMLMFKPTLIGDIGWQLSVAATVGILYVGEILKSQIIKFSNWKWIQDYFVPTLAATIATAPIIWWHFGRVSGIGVFVNLAILPVVPLVMLLSAITLFFLPMAYLLYVPLWWMVTLIRFFG